MEGIAGSVHANPAAVELTRRALTDSAQAVIRSAARPVHAGRAVSTHLIAATAVRCCGAQIHALVTAACAAGRTAGNAQTACAFLTFCARSAARAAVVGVAIEMDALLYVSLRAEHTAAGRGALPIVADLTQAAGELTPAAVECVALRESARPSAICLAARAVGDASARATVLPSSAGHPANTAIVVVALHVDTLPGAGRRHAAAFQLSSVKPVGPWGRGAQLGVAPRRCGECQ